MKNNNHDITAPSEKQGYKKKYLLRKLEEQEAEKEIENFEEGPDCVYCQEGYCYLHRMKIYGPRE